MEEGEKGETVTAEGAIRQQVNRGGRNKINKVFKSKCKKEYIRFELLARLHGRSLRDK